ncbi:zinc finger, CCHC-type containing protein [Tanacetum coccineum]
MKPHESTSEFAGKLSSIQAKFKSLGGTLKDKVLVRKLLNSVPKKFLPIVASIEQYQEIDTMQFEEVVGRITAFEERLKSQDEPENNYQNKLLLASSNNQGGGRGHGRNFTKNKSSYGKGTSRGSIDKSKLRCYECGEHGHFAKECTKWKHNKIKQEESHLIYDTDNEPTLLSTVEAARSRFFPCELRAVEEGFLHDFHLILLFITKASCRRISLLPSLFGASLNSTTLPRCLRTRGDPVQRTRGFENLVICFYEGWANHKIMISEVDARLASGVLSGDLVVNVEAVMGGSSPTFGPGKRVSVEKPSGGESSLPLVMPEKQWITGVCVPQSLSWRESLDRVEKVAFDLVKCYLCTSFIEGNTAKDVGLRVADSHTGNHREDDFTPLETI